MQSSRVVHDAASPGQRTTTTKRKHSPPHRLSSLHEPSAIRACRSEYQPRAQPALSSAPEGIHLSSAQPCLLYPTLRIQPANPLHGNPYLQPAAFLRPSVLEH